MRLVLNKVYDKDGKHLGDEIVYTEDLTPEFLAELKADTLADAKGWVRHHQILKDNGFDVVSA